MLTEALSPSPPPPGLSASLASSSRAGVAGVPGDVGGRGDDLGVAAMGGGVTAFEAEESGVLRALLHALVDGRHQDGDGGGGDCGDPVIDLVGDAVDIVGDIGGDGVGGRDEGEVTTSGGNDRLGE
ncbi:unnamed protein product, partial [Ectocarpus sp. 6 AP-2014]